jgi:hypothetical protein
LGVAWSFSGWNLFRRTSKNSLSLSFFNLCRPSSFPHLHVTM